MTEIEGAVWDYNGVVFEVGDRVKIARFAETAQVGGMGEGVDWDNAWTRLMDDQIGRIVTIGGIYVEGVEFVEDNGDGYLFPLSVLDKAEE